MRLILIYDLPAVEDNDKRIYNRFHTNIVKLGFYMLQYLIYVKVVTNDITMKQYIFFTLVY